MHAHLRIDSQSAVNRGVVYAAYVSDMLRVHNSLALSVHTFTDLLRLVCILRYVVVECKIRRIDLQAYIPC